MKTQIPFRTFRTASLFLTRVSLISLAFFFAVPRTPASDSPRATFLKNLLGEVEGPETALPGGNTADGAGALQNNTTGIWNSAFGDRALNQNTTGGGNNAVGVHALRNNTQGTHNVADGVKALFSNTTGIGNVGSGFGALYHNVNGLANTAFGSLAGVNTTGDLNVTLGAGAGINTTTGSDNIALGTLAGSNVTDGNNNIHIGNDGVAGDSNTIRVGDLAVNDSVFLAGIVPMTPEAPNQAVLVDPRFARSPGFPGPTRFSRSPRTAWASRRSGCSAVRLEQWWHNHRHQFSRAVQSSRVFSRHSDQQNQQHNVYCKFRGGLPCNVQRADRAGVVAGQHTGAGKWCRSRTERHTNRCRRFFDRHDYLSG